MTEAPTLMAQEIAESPAATARLCEPAAQDSLRRYAAHLADLDPPVLLTLARGSSDHAAATLAYAVELALGLPVVSVRPSVRSIYGTSLKARGAAVLAVSQSGQSADIVAMAADLARNGAWVLGLTNTNPSPLTAASSATLPMLAGPERAVAATKSFVNSLVAGLWLVAHWSGDRGLQDALTALPEDLARALEADIGPIANAMTATDRALVISRGPGLGLALESALKLQETNGVLAMAYSAAEVLHGPSAVIHAGCPVFALAPDRAAGMEQACSELSALGATLHPIPAGGPKRHPLTDPLPALLHVYRAAEVAARNRGLHPDTPFHLRKETVTR